MKAIYQTYYIYINVLYIGAVSYGKKKTSLISAPLREKKMNIGSEL